MTLPFIPADKANHFCYGAIISTIIIIMFSFMRVLDNHDLDMTLAAVIGFAAATILGIIKEGLDKLSNVKALKAGLPISHGVEVKDILFTSAGGLLPAIPIILIHMINYSYP